MIIIKNSNEVQKMQKAGKIVAKVLSVIGESISEGITTAEIDRIASRIIKENNGIASFKGYGGFPASVCTSVNDQVIHGIPGNYRLSDGDIISVDVGVLYDEFHADSARTFAVGNISEEARTLIEVTEQSFFQGLKECREGNRISDISSAVQSYAEGKGFSVVRNFVGHGIGRSLHEDPEVPNFISRVPSRNPRLAEGMTIAIEPMVNQGSCDVVTLNDGWTVVTKDGRLSAHYEHSVAVTKDEAVLLTF